MVSRIRSSFGYQLGLVFVVIFFALLACNSGNGVQGPVNHPPGAVILIQPDSGATDVSSNPTLIWTGGEDADGDSVAFDVYLGTTEPLSLVGTASDTSFNMASSLAPMSGFLWRIVARDDRGAATHSTTWPFTTGTTNLPPSAAENPNPSDSASGVAPTVVLRWSGAIDPDGDPVTFDVYFGTTDPPPFVRNQGFWSYNPPGNLNRQTSYYWQIVAKDDRAGETSGPVWNFLTAP